MFSRRRTRSWRMAHMDPWWRQLRIHRGGQDHIRSKFYTYNTILHIFIFYYIIFNYIIYLYIYIHYQVQTYIILLYVDTWITTWFFWGFWSHGGSPSHWGRTDEACCEKTCAAHSCSKGLVAVEVRRLVDFGFWIGKVRKNWRCYMILPRKVVI